MIYQYRDANFYFSNTSSEFFASQPHLLPHVDMPCRRVFCRVGYSWWWPAPNEILWAPVSTRTKTHCRVCLLGGWSNLRKKHTNHGPFWAVSNDPQEHLEHENIQNFITTTIDQLTKAPPIYHLPSNVPHSFELICKHVKRCSPCWFTVPSAPGTSNEIAEDFISSMVCTGVWPPKEDKDLSQIGS